MRLRGEAIAREQMVEALQGRLALREQQFLEEFQALQRGWIWRLVTVLRCCRLAVIPTDTWRERSLHLVKHSFRILRREGLPTVIHRATRRSLNLAANLMQLTSRFGKTQLSAATESANCKLIATSDTAFSADDTEILRQIVAFFPRKVKPDAAPIDVVVPVYKERGETLQCIRSILASRPAHPYELIIILDAGPDAALNASLRDLADRGLLTLLENSVNLGFVKAANRGLALHRDRDVVLLNSDAEVCHDWLDRLNRAAYSADEVATVTPLSNHASICSYPHFCRDNTLPDGLSTDQLDRLCAEYNDASYVEVPTGVGSCMYFRRDCLDEVGLFDEEHSGKGYGEETDFCVRASKRGRRHLLTADTFVYQRGSTSYGASRAPSVERALRVLESLHPDHAVLVAGHLRADPALVFRRRLDLSRLAGPSPAILYVLHSLGGGTQRHVLDLAGGIEKEGWRAILLRPLDAGRISMERPAVKDTPNLIFALPEERWTLLEALRGLGVAHIHVHHTIDMPGEVFRLLQDLRLPYDWTIHDYYAICPRINLIDESELYCGEPAASSCQSCLDRNGAARDGMIDIRRWRDDYGAWLAGARKVFVPHLDAAERLRKYFPEVAFIERRHFESHPAPRTAAVPLAPGEPMRVAVIGAIGPNKGVEIVLGCARDGLARGLRLSFHVVGHTSCDDQLCELPNVTLTGRYREEEIFDLLAGLRCHCAFFASVWPETYAYTLSIALLGGLFPITFDLGAPAARIRECGFGHVIPLTGDCAAINNTLLALAPRLAKVPTEPRWTPANYQDLLGEYYGLKENPLLSRSVA
jgi:GT2 family glycosyltransferase/glycosyltransferase involved in cell wall biosynthesis